MHKKLRLVDGQIFISLPDIAEFLAIETDSFSADYFFMAAGELIAVESTQTAVYTPETALEKLAAGYDFDIRLLTFDRAAGRYYVYDISGTPEGFKILINKHTGEVFSSTYGGIYPGLNSLSFAPEQ